MGVHPPLKLDERVLAQLTACDGDVWLQADEFIPCSAGVGKCIEQDLMFEHDQSLLSFPTMCP
jgi:hypothetical protein